MEDPRSLGGLDVRRVTVHPAALPLTTRLAGAAAPATSTRPAVYVRVEGAAGEVGWGECCALATPTYTAESSALAARVLVEHCAPLLLAAGPVTVDGVRPLLDRSISGWLMAKATAEAAVLDALLRRHGRSLVGFLQGSRSVVPCGAAVGLPPEGGGPAGLAAVAGAVRSRLEEGYQRVRLKIVPMLDGQDWTVRPVRHLRAEGIDGTLLPDGNAAYGPADLKVLLDLRDHGVDLVEQPFSPRRRAEARALRGRGMRIAADESIECYEDFEHALVGGADGPYADVVCLKWSRVGGILEAARIAEACVSRGFPLFVGGMIGLGMAADLALSSTVPDELDVVGDHGPSGRWIAAEHDPAVPVRWERPGHVAVPRTPGVADLDPERIVRALVADALSVELNGGGTPRVRVAVRRGGEAVTPSPYPGWPGSG